MELKPLGNTNVMVPEIGLGTWQYRGDPAVAHRALELGGPLIDTAEYYRTEGYVGQAVHGNRDSYFIATKVSSGHLAHDQVITAAQGSLKALETGYIDLYQIHAPSSSVPIEETMGAMKKLLVDGTVRHVGVSNFSTRQLQEAQQALHPYPVVSNQVLYNLFRREIEDELLPYCEQNQVTVIAFSPLAQGRLEAELHSRPRLVDVLDETCAATGKTRAQVLLRWCVHRPWTITIPATNKVHRVNENYGASGWQLTPEQYAALAQAAR
jgi:diketogulonate reductase-like aldo/keto reductase